ncbi:hypothetical protein TNCV_581861 [Trichonephila clavipes]|nr:hypothetical protein TNCV_581861 [Trichonephila clavipes]
MKTRFLTYLHRMKSQVGVKSGDLGDQGGKQGLSHQYAQSAETKVYRLVVKLELGCVNEGVTRLVGNQNPLSQH